MSLTLSSIEAIAPDQPSLKAAAKLMKPAKWPLRAKDEASGLIWGECQGSGANPYRVIADRNDLGYKCTCPSRKFPCKHALALMWMFAEEEGAYEEAAIPEWVNDWVGRRRKSSGSKEVSANTGAKKNITAATKVSDAPVDPEKEEKRKAAAAKRAEATRATVLDATFELEQWIGDQLRAGLTVFLNETTERCRRIAARMVDAKAAALAGRIDELPARLLALPSEERVDAAIAELGKIVLLLRAWRAVPDDPDLRREIIAPETREQILDSTTSPEVAGRWEVLGERIQTRRDGLVSQATWLLNLDGTEQRFALLLDFFPANLGKRQSAFVAGEQFEATLKFYPGRNPLRALIAERNPSDSGSQDWSGEHFSPPFAQILPVLEKAPWAQSFPILLSPGRLCVGGQQRGWWRAEDAKHTLPLINVPEPVARGARISALMGVWDGVRLDPIAAQTNFGRLTFDA